MGGQAKLADDLFLFTRLPLSSTDSLFIKLLALLLPQPGFEVKVKPVIVDIHEEHTPAPVVPRFNRNGIGALPNQLQR